ncbi:MAG: threonine--tRNA ligase [Candidatus Pacearchaeota archaeon]|nr:threonine--tRNA ligase [Candidatus Pacearchaeota archaeon]
MRILTLHCDYIRFKPIQKAIKEPEKLSEERKKEIEVKDPLVILTAVEKGDNNDIVRKMIDAVKQTAEDVRAKNIVIYPYAHLSSNLANPDTALEYLSEAESTLKKEGFNVTRAPFGYYKEFELKVKGHPLSELSKEFKLETFKEEVYDYKRLLKEITRTKLDTSKLKENDHRIIGQKLDLFSFNEASPSSVFWHKNGWIIYNELLNFSRELQSQAGYQEISTPQIFDTKIWKISGHWEHYKNNMFLTKFDNRDFGVKPMNCPGHILVYKTKVRSYKELPIRFSEYGTVHRQELSGVLSGIFRVLKFTQDDAHIFCTIEQLETEISNILELIKKVYSTFNFEYKLSLSTRPEKYMGKKEEWDKAEEMLEKALKKSKIKYEIHKGEGAFYGPKIDIIIKDSQKREWQCATIQLDMQMPQRFELTYIGKDNKEYPLIMIHRAIFGSLERFIGILLEHLNGNLPLWLSPIQVRVIDFTERNTKTAEKIIEQIKKEIPNIRIDSDFRTTTINEKVRDAEMQKIPYIVTIGDKEEKSNTLAIKERGKKPVFGVKLETFISELSKKIKTRSIN